MSAPSPRRQRWPSNFAGLYRAHFIISSDNILIRIFQTLAQMIIMIRDNGLIMISFAPRAA